MKNFDLETAQAAGKRFSCFIADSEAMIRAAQELRYRVFAREMGAKLKSADEELDSDEIDAYCDHLVVYDHQKQKIAGYTRRSGPGKTPGCATSLQQRSRTSRRVATLPYASSPRNSTGSRVPRSA